MRRRNFLAALAAAPAAPLSAAGDAVVRLGFDKGFENAGAWGGAASLTGPAPAEPLIDQREGAGVLDATRAWLHAGAGRVAYTNPKIAALDDFSAAVWFRPARRGAGTLLNRTGQWRIVINSYGALTANLHHTPLATQRLDITSIAVEDVWYRVAIAFDRKAGKLHFHFRQLGGRSVAGSFTLLANVLGAATDRTRDRLDIGSNAGADRFFGYLDNVALWDRALSPEELAAEAAAEAPSVRDVGLESFSRYLAPLEREAGAALPARSDVCLSSRWWHPARKGDPHDTLVDMRAFGVTRLEWVYDNSPAHIDLAHQAGARFIATINGNDAASGRPHSVRDFDGKWAGFSWMAAWKDAEGLPPGAGCVNNPGFGEHLLSGVRKALDAGADGIQYDDWAANASVFSSAGDCLCEHCLARFREWPGNPQKVDYKRYLAAQGVAAQMDYLKFTRRSPMDPMHALYRRFQLQSIRDSLLRVRGAVAAARLKDRRRPTLAVNASLVQFSQDSLPFACGDAPDYQVFEGSEDSVEGVFFAAKAAEALQKISVMSPFPFVKDKTRANIALRYALGQLCLVPYDIWMRTTDQPRAFGTTAEYGDLFAFVRANAALFDGMETVATVGIAVDTGKPEPPRLKPLLAALAQAGAPFVLAPAGRGAFTASTPALWKRRLPYLIDLAGLADARGEFPNARLLSAALTPEEMARVAVLQVEAPQVVGVVRGRSEGGRALAIHLVNYNFDESGASAPVAQVGVRLLQAGFWGAIRSAELLAPGAAPRRLPVERFARGWRLVVPSVGAWAVLRIDV
jgi:hypothetical protein